MSAVAPGWYTGSGDPAGTVRYWDGNRWVGEPKNLQGETPPSPVVFASIGERVSGRLLDALILLMILLPLQWSELTDAIEAGRSLGPGADDGALAEALGPRATWRAITVAFIAIAYDWGFYAFKGATPGKMIVGARVVKLDGHHGPLGIVTGFLRSLRSTVGALAGFVSGAALPFATSGTLGDILIWGGIGVGVVSLIMMRSDDRNRSVMDRVASTMVIKN